MIDFANLKYLEIPEGEVVEIKRGDEILWNKPTDKPYTELLYLESTGTQYINTGITFKNTDECCAEAQMLQTQSDKFFVAPKTWNNNTNRFSLGGFYVSKYICAYGSIGTPSSIYIPEIPNQLLDKHTFSYKDKIFTIEDTGSTYDASTARWGGDTDELRLFWGYNAPTKCRIYTYQQKRDGKLIRDFIPVLDSDNVPCLFDKVSEQFFYNNGTGDFLYQMRFEDEYETIEYLESTGKEFIDTEMTISTSTDTVECVYQSLEDVKYKWIFGEHDNNARFGVGTGDGSGQRNVAYGTGTTKVGDSYIFNSPHTFLADATGVYIDGNKITSYKAFTSTSTIYLFNLNLNGNDYCNKARIYSYKHWRNGELVRDMIPVKRLLDGEAGLYDRANKVFYPLFSTFNLRREKTEEEMYQMWIEDIGHEEEIL